MGEEKVVQQAEKLTTQLIDRIETYMSSFNQKENRLYAEYFKASNVASRESLEVQIGVATKSGFEYVPLNFECITSANIQFGGLPFKSVNIKLHFPDVLFGETGFVPIIEFQVKTPKAYFGNVGLVWEDLSKQKGELKFHPFDFDGDMEGSLLKYYNENLVDQFSDMLSRSNEKNCETVRKYMNECLYGKKKELFRYEINKSGRFNAITVPLYLMYDEDIQSSSIHFFSYAYEDSWINAAEVVLLVLRPISILTKYFKEDGEFMTLDEIEALEETEKSGVPISEKKKAIKDEKIQERVKDKKKEDWDPFKMAKKTVKRDEFGYVISGKNKETGVLDTELNRQQVISAAERLTKDSRPKEEKIVNFKKYRTAEEWYEENKGKRYRVINNFEGLSFVETGKVKAVQALKPPFVLQFGISQLKVMRQLTLKQAIELVYDVYNKGLLKEV